MITTYKVSVVGRGVGITLYDNWIARYLQILSAQVTNRLIIACDFGMNILASIYYSIFCCTLRTRVRNANWNNICKFYLKKNMSSALQHFFPFQIIRFKAHKIGLFQWLPLHSTEISNQPFRQEIIAKG